MLTVHFVRHGESAANAGTATSDPALIPLTDRGWEQARAVAATFDQAPTLIVTSPYERAADTAKPTIARFPDVPVEIWPVEEFTYLSLSRCANTTAADRKPWVESYWNRSDVDETDGRATESFRDLINRAIATIDRLQRLNGSVVIFGHGQFIQAARWIISLNIQSVDFHAMRNFRELDLRSPITNCQKLSFCYNKQKWS